MPTQAFFLPADGPAGGQRLCLYHPAQGPARAAVVYVHPFAEEMNKSRRMAAVTSRAMAEAGCAVLQIDLLGCGDSSGDFGDATWDAWVDDVLQAARWLRQRVDAPLWLWGLRAGCLLTAEAARRLEEPVNLLWWAPVASGKQALQQFLRLKTASEMLGADAQGAGAGKGGAQALKAELAAGRQVEVAGYLLAPALADGLERATLSPAATSTSPAVRAGHLHVIELNMSADAGPSPAVSQLLSAWHTAGMHATGQVVTGPSFWQTTEIEEAPALVATSIDALTSAEALSPVKVAA